MSITEAQVIAAIKECDSPGDNLGFFAKQAVEAGERLGKALNLYNLVKDNDKGQRILRDYLRAAGQERVSKNIALVVTRYVLKPVTTRNDTLCSDYARVFEHVANSGATREQLVEVFSNGEYKAKLREVRQLAPRRKRSRHAQKPGVDEIQIVRKRAGSAETILRTASVADGVDLNDEQQLQQLVMSMMLTAPDGRRSVITDQSSDGS